ncbi:helix-turn-helix transcriptional regulator [Demequina zhanjiangensis]|uniref:AraC family transcriptional regulator n=1 Tax=Demequina zhanjiangensis TaxID=3051659 RepID=A0ABT8G454_9MICO|nr:AraC family transcriptional regulator [Demequina sp. SYSU T00b26]MDN4473931.1 AraC family transcriptional regulator [Demequina sp. SYSU T00b26]
MSPVDAAPGDEWSDPPVFVLRACLDAPAALELHDAGDLTILVAETGGFHVSRGDRHAEVAPGDALLMVGRAPYVLATDPGAALAARVDAQHVCHSVDGRPLKDEWALGIRMWGHRADAGVRLLVASVEDPRLAALAATRVGDDLRVVTGLRTASRYAAALAEEAASPSVADDDGVLRRLAELVALDAMRTATVLPAEGAGDRMTREVAATVRSDLAGDWTVASMAARAGMSRSAFTARFSALFGQTPGAALTRWRMDEAASLLASTDATVDSVARAVGYADGFALSDAFQRVVGVRPRDFRRG